ncbi:hypothetical protein FE391_29805 [Nonomuraea sp. KC401]|uniref:hypothetical protein n=1 Tax=unclassified Nonomuraea TaxID=2593643 RepID=UPI0010FD7D7B|nr:MULTISPECIES: hypothetical protein [unclassified Nonomuraea]NBE93392.1 hypothetical protein [Nonomuraea sp. K271]TLF62683.1 hypothetical protein FE391_29805 [Nonomuraea sp. KC401]
MSARKIPLPPYKEQPVDATAWHERIKQPRMPRGTYAANHPPPGSRRSPPGLVIHPDDAVGTRLPPDVSRLTGCCGISGVVGPNLVCAACGAEIAFHQADRHTENQVTLLAEAVILSYAHD